MSKQFCVSCGQEIGGERWAEVCEKCTEQYGDEDFAPEVYCNGCGADLSELGGLCDTCLLGDAA